MARLHTKPRPSIIEMTPKKKVFEFNDEDFAISRDDSDLDKNDDSEIMSNDDKDEEHAEEEEEDSDDEAPEEEGFKDSKSELLKKKQQEKESLKALEAEEKELRRKNDEILKKQREEAAKRKKKAEEEEQKKKAAQEEEEHDPEQESLALKQQQYQRGVLLDTSLLEQMDKQKLRLPGQQDSDSKKKSFPAQVASLVKGTKSLKQLGKKLAMKNNPNASKVVKKGPVRVSVLKRSKKSMMPPKSQIIEDVKSKWYKESQRVFERR